MKGAVQNGNKFWTGFVFNFPRVAKKKMLSWRS